VLVLIASILIGLGIGKWLFHIEQAKNYSVRVLGLMAVYLGIFALSGSLASRSWWPFYSGRKFSWTSWVMPVLFVIAGFAIVKWSSSGPVLGKIAGIPHRGIRIGSCPQVVQRYMEEGLR
jgi:hypothetical protein